MSVIKPIMQDVLKTLLTYLTDDELMHFNKIHRPIDEMGSKSLLAAIRLVERTLNRHQIDYTTGVVKSLETLKESLDK